MERVESRQREVQQPLPLNNIIYCNIRGLYPKSDQTKVPMLKELAHHENAIFLALTETHLHKDHLDAEINMENYTAIRANRHIRSHGGVANYIRNDTAANMETLDSFSNGKTELLGVHLKNLNLLVITIYRPPNTTLENFNQAITRLTEILKNPPNQSVEIMITGDFNFPHVNWSNMTINGGTLDEKAQASELIKVMEEYYLHQVVTEPTRGNNILDLFLTNSPTQSTRIKQWIQ